MAVSNTEDFGGAVLSDDIRSIRGIRLAALSSGLRYRGRDDFALLEIAAGSAVACVYTRNKFCAAPVTVARRHQQVAVPRFLVVNAGNANAGTGVRGEQAAVEVCEAVARAAHCEAAEVLPFSTGVIGQQLDSAALAARVPELYNGLHEDAWPQAAAAILTTDTRRKLRSVTVEVDGARITCTGMTKGSGMIRPDMATMLAYVATDAAIAQPLLELMIQEASAASFNCITVDGDTSTNDALVLIATGAAGNPCITERTDPRYACVAAALRLLCVELAKDIVRDGEGATKFVTIRVSGGDSADDCRQVADAVAHSPLVKTALFASDPNWGRILAAVGRSGVATLKLEAINIEIGREPIVRGGEPYAEYDEARVAAVMSEPEIEITINIGTGDTLATLWTCDLSYDYVKINAEYRS